MFCSRIYVLLIAAFLGSNSAAQSRTVSASSFLHAVSEKVNPSVAGAMTFEVDPVMVAKLFVSSGALQLADFPGGYGDLVTLDLKPARSPFNRQTKFVQGTAKGDIELPAPQFEAYCGKVLGEPNSRVMLTAFGGKLLVSIQRESGETYVFGPAKNEVEGSTHVLTLEGALFGKELSRFNCLNEDMPELNTRPNPQRGSSVQSKSDLLQIDIAVEADTCFYHAAGSDMTKVVGYIASLFAMSSVIYEDEAGITWHIPWVKVWTDTDPYNVKGDGPALTNKVRDYWTHHYQDVPRDVAHVMTSIGYGGGGFGWFALCDTTYSYSVSSPQTGHNYPTFAFTYDAYIVAHEVGHNFGLPHSHSCDWNPPLDTCFTQDDPSYQIGDACCKLPITPRPNPGTIMSYCANTNYGLSGNDFTKYKLNMTFSAKVDSALRDHAEKTSCVEPPAAPAIILTSPRGSETFPGDTTIMLMWTSAHVDNVGFEYTSDGITWKPIVASVPATTGQYSWTIPNGTTKKMRVRIFDAANASIADTSLLVFSVNKVADVLSSNVGSEFHVNPTPAREWLTVTGPNANVRYELVDEQGGIRLRGNGIINNEAGMRINLESLASGTYFLRVASSLALASSVRSANVVLPFTHIQ